MTNRFKEEQLEQMERGKDKMCRQKAKRNERMDTDLMMIVKKMERGKNRTNSYLD